MKFKRPFYLFKKTSVFLLVFGIGVIIGVLLVVLSADFSSIFNKHSKMDNLVSEDKFANQKFQTKDDWTNGDGTSGEYIDEEISWSEVRGSPFSGYDTINYAGNNGTTNLVSGIVKKDSRTGLWWTDRSILTLGNWFTLEADGERPTGDFAIGFCNALNTVNFGGHNDWYLPTQKELMQAYIDGSANTWSSSVDEYFWSSTEYSLDSRYAWAVNLYNGHMHYNPKDNSYYVRCVRR